MNKIDLSGINNIIFDLGNVVIDLDIEATDRAFKELSGRQYDSIMKSLNDQSFFEGYETGKLATAEFVNQLQEEIKGDVSKESIINAWNAMLLDIPDSRYDILNLLKKRYRTFCLSNTNELHIDYIFNQLKATKGVSNLDDYFEKVYLSHEMGMRKPTTEIFEAVVEANQLKPSETLFIDDTAMHLEGAQKVGLQTFHMRKGLTLEKVID